MERLFFKNGSISQIIIIPFWEIWFVDMPRYYCDYCKSYIKNDSVCNLCIDWSSRHEVERSIFVEQSTVSVSWSTIKRYSFEELFLCRYSSITWLCTISNMAMALQNNELVTFTIWFLHGFYMVSKWFPLGLHLVSIWSPLSFHLVSIWSPFDFHSSSLLLQHLFVCFEQIGTQQTRTRICFVHIN